MASREEKVQMLAETFVYQGLDTDVEEIKKDVRSWPDKRIEMEFYLTFDNEVPELLYPELN